MPTDDFPPHDPDFPDVDPATGDERETDPNPLLPWLETDAEFEGVGAHRHNPRFDLATALHDATS